jgi:hypothetical protein
LSDRSFSPSTPHDNAPDRESDPSDQEAIVSETDVASAGRSCVALLALFVVIIALFAIWLLYRSAS